MNLKFHTMAFQSLQEDESANQSSQLRGIPSWNNKEQRRQAMTSFMSKIAVCYFFGLLDIRKRPAKGSFLLERAKGRSSARADLLVCDGQGPARPARLHRSLAPPRCSIPSAPLVPLKKVPYRHLFQWSGRRESNPQPELGKLVFYH